MEQQFFDARILDAQSACERSGAPKFIGFLTSEELATAVGVLNARKAKFCFFGGYEDASRVVLACLPDWCDEPQIPISAITITYKDCYNLTHRDFLGSLMALGITRETVGDILIERGRAVLFIKEDMAQFVVSQLKKVGNVGITISCGCKEPLPNRSSRIEKSCTVSSLRLDCVVSALAGVSRNSAATLIENGVVSINSIICKKNTASIKSGDNITVKGTGKFFIENTDSTTKKGRTILVYSMYKNN